jgi:hypothetical protein
VSEEIYGGPPVAHSADFFRMRNQQEARPSLLDRGVLDSVQRVERVTGHSGRGEARRCQHSLGSPSSLALSRWTSETRSYEGENKPKLGGRAFLILGMPMQ